MTLPGPIENHPDYLLLSEYFTDEEVGTIIQSGIPINRPGVVPSLQVPPGNKGCAGLGDMGLGIMAIPSSDSTWGWGSGYDPTVVPWTPERPALIDVAPPPPVLSSGSIAGGTATTMSATGGGSQTGGGGGVPAPDPALEWVEDNWVMIAAALAGLVVLGVATRR